MSRFTLPRDIYYGANALENLKNLKGSRAVLVLGGGSMKKFGFVDKALGYLKEAGIETRLIENVEPDPSVETVMSGAAVMREFEPDWIISMGGGSPIDAAKAMWAFYEYPETTFEDLITPFSFPELRQKARFCAIPSTSGTATEVTAFSVITDYQKGIKYPLADFNITPDVAIIDPALAETMPPKLVAHTGMDALTHAIEAYVSTLHTVFTDPLALKAIHIVEKDLLRSFNGGMGCREEMHYGQCLAGMAFSNALLGIVHSMAHKTGAAFSTGHITHGLANAMYLPYVIAYNAKADGVAERYADIARTMGVVGDTTAELVEGLRAKIRSMNDAMGIPNTLKDFGIIEDEFKEKLDAIAANAVGDACTGSNPRPIDPLALKAIHIVEKDLLRSFNGGMGCREEMHYGQCLAGMAFSNALLGIVHSMAHKTGAAFSTGHITHGLANAMYLPYVIAYNAKADGVAERYADIARTMGVVGDTTAELVEGLRAKIRSMNDAMGIPNTLKDFGIIEDEFKEKLDAIAANAVGDACTGSNPRPIDPATMAKLFTCIYYGTEVDF